MTGLNLIAESQGRPQSALLAFLSGGELEARKPLEQGLLATCSQPLVIKVQLGQCQCQRRMRLPSNEHPPGSGASCACTSSSQCTLCCLGYRSMVRIAKLGAMARPADAQAAPYTDSDSEMEKADT